MKLKDGFELRTLCGEKIVSATGLDNLNFNKLLSLNKTAAYLWEKFYGKEFTVEDLVDALTEAYDVDREVAATDCGKLVEAWKDAGVLD